MLAIFLLAQLGRPEVALPSTGVFNPLTGRTVARGTDGAFFVFDRFEHRILMFAPNQAEGRLVARKGSGPGELLKTNGLFLFGNALYVLSADHIQFFDTDGTYRQRIRLPPGLSVQKTATRQLRANELFPGQEVSHLKISDDSNQKE